MRYAALVFASSFGLLVLAGASAQARRVNTATVAVVPVRPGALALAPHGGLYIADDALDEILERLPDGRFAVVAGDGMRGFAGDGGRAVDARLDAPAGLAVRADGTIYFADSLNNRVRAISPAGIITTVAGNGQGGWTRSAAPARTVPILSPEAVTVGPDGRVYIAAGGYGEVLRLEQNGTLTRIAGIRRFAGVYGVGRPASSASADGVNGLAFDRAGDLYLAGSNTKTLLMIDRGGVIRLPAGTSGFYPRGTGGLVTTSTGHVYGINTQDIIEATPTRLRTIYSFAGRTIGTITGFLPDGIAVAGDGSIYTDTFYGNGWSNGSAIVILPSHGKPRPLWIG